MIGQAEAPDHGHRPFPRVELGEVCTIVAKQVDPKLQQYACLPHINGENIETGTGRLLDVRSAAEDGMTSNKYLFEPGDVLYSKLRPYLRKAVVAEFRGLCSADMYPIRVKPERMEAHYLACLLLSDEFTAYADTESRRARMPKLNREQLFAYQATIPPTSKQRQIFMRLRAQLDELERARAALQTQSDATRQIPAALLREAFDAPAATKWQRVLLGDLLQRIEAGQCLSCEERPATDAEWGVLKVSAVTWSEFRPNENKVLPLGFSVRDGAEVCRGDLLISRSNTTELVGAVCLVNETRPRLMLSDKTLRLVPREELVLKQFMLLALRSQRCRKFIEQNAGGASSSMKNITQDTIRSIPISLPGIEQQRRIVAEVLQRLEHADGLATSLREKLIAVNKLPGALLSAAFQGSPA